MSFFSKKPAPVAGFLVLPVTGHTSKSWALALALLFITAV
jgi:hypothetical protein